MSRTAGTAPILLFVGAALAGCLGGEPSGLGRGGQIPVAFSTPVSQVRLPVPDYDFAKAIDATHGGVPDAHAIPQLHEGAHGLTLVGYHPLTGLAGGESPLAQDTGFIAMDTWKNYLCIAHFAGLGGAVIVDLADPAQPKVASSVESGMVNSDCQFTDDGDYLIVAAYIGVHENALPIPNPALSGLGSQGVEVWDVKDKTAPKFLFRDAQAANPNAYHNVFTAKIHDVNYVFSTYTGLIFALEPGATQLQKVAQVDKADHDIWVGQHPVTGDWVMITGAGGGTRLYLLNDPAKPVVGADWEDHDGYTGWHRQWPLLNTVDGRALVVVAGETGGGATLPYTVLDFTDPRELVEVGHWRIPGKPVSNEPNFYTFSPHEFETFDGYVIAGNYHAGVWVFDIGTPQRAAEPATIGYYLPHEVAQLRGGVWNKPFLQNPNVWGAYVDERGYIVTADHSSGLYVLKFGATRPSP